jgi:acetylornithine deacetylase/succinyl-diaminopimelate desuccinylase-like protein
MPRLAALLAAASLLTPPLAPALAQSGTAQPAAPIDWAALTDEGTRILSEYLRINTTNPPGNELAGIHFLERILEREGIEVHVLDTAELGPGRGNLYARLRGDGSKKAIALVHHVDVVPANASTWSVDPFSGAIKDSAVWGRGALDMKGEGIVQLMALVALKRSGVPLTRDIVYIANADEELGSTGAEVFTQRHADLLRDVEFLLTEGGDNLVEHGQVRYIGIGVAEKRTFWQRITAKGVPSHGSRPTKDNPVPRLVAALDRLARYETPLHVTPGVAKYFRDIAGQYTGERRAWLRDVRAAIREPRARAWLTSNVYWNAILRNTISLTVLQGSNKTNVIPAEALAELDIRLLPDANPHSVLATLRRVAGDTSLEWTPLISPKAPLESPTDTDLFRAIERAARERIPGVLVTTPMLTGATDRPYYRALGIVTYGFDPFLEESSVTQRGVHGNDEHVSLRSLAFGIRYLYDVLRYVQ